MVGIVRLLVGEKHRNVSEQGNTERIRNQGQGSREMGSLKQRRGWGQVGDVPSDSGPKTRKHKAAGRFKIACAGRHTKHFSRV